MFDNLRAWPNWVLIGSAGLLTVAAFPPSPLGFLAYFSLIPLMVLFIKDDFHLGFEKGYFFGLILNLGMMYWLAVNKGTEWYWSTLSMVSSILFLALNYGLIGLVVGIIGRYGGQKAGIWSFPIVWAAVEYLRSFGTLGFTWNNLCYTQSRAVQLIQIVALSGPNGLSFIIVLVNVLLVLILINGVKRWRTSLRYVYCLLGIFLILEIFGGITLSAKRPTTNNRCPVHVALIQPNVDPNRKWDGEAFGEVIQILHSLTDSACAEPRDLIVWPESAVPAYLRHNRHQLLDAIIAQITRLNVHLLTGVPDYEFNSSEDYKIYNSTFLLCPRSRRIESYNKIKLVPFGEYIPLSEVFPELDNLNLGQGNFAAGNEMHVFSIPLTVEHIAAQDTVLQFHTVVCYESTFPYIVRKGVKMGSELLVIVSNDAWFGNNSAPYLHAEIARFRAIENHIPVVRSANTGISVIYDAYGRKLTQARFGEMNWLTAVIPQGTGHTVYARLGDWFGIINVVVSVLFLGFVLIRRKITCKNTLT
jgi:apolipoprotein N-acyltransferase